MRIILFIKKNLISILTIILIMAIIRYSKTNIKAVKQGLEIWVNNVVPSIFPFFVATEILSNTNLIFGLGKKLEKTVNKIFNVPGEGAFALIMGIICGYPSGAKIVAGLKRKDVITKEEAERLITFTNNSGPLFVIGTVGICLLNSSQIGYILLISQIISCILVGIIFKNWKKNSGDSLQKKRNVDIRKEQKNFGEILNDSIRNSVITITNIGGFIVLVSVILSILNESSIFTITGKIFEKVHISSKLGNSIIAGLIELTNGVNQMAKLKVTTLNVGLISFLIGAGGLSVLFQVYSIIAKENISIKPYIYGKILQGIFAFLVTIFFIWII